jgi:hypothetical protein
VPYFPEHDIELSFDVVYDLEDIDRINRIRYVLSKSLTR